MWNGVKDSGVMKACHLVLEKWDRRLTTDMGHIMDNQASSQVMLLSCRSPQVPLSMADFHTCLLWCCGNPTDLLFMVPPKEQFPRPWTQHCLAVCEEVGERVSPFLRFSTLFPVCYITVVILIAAIFQLPSSPLLSNPGLLFRFSSKNLHLDPPMTPLECYLGTTLSYFAILYLKYWVQFHTPIFLLVSTAQLKLPQDFQQVWDL